MESNDLLLSSSPTSVFIEERPFATEEESCKISLEEFLLALPEAIEQGKNQTSLPDATKNDKSRDDDMENGSVSKLMKKLSLDDEDLEAYAHFDASKNYTRNLIASDGRLYTLLILCWNPGRSSPIHDHPCDGCWMTVLKGSVQECRYVKDEPSDSMECVSDNVYQEGQLAYITDSMGYHKVGNPTLTVPAVTLHLYCPPFDVCKIWLDPEHSSKPSRSCVCYHSEYGVIV